MKAAFAALLVSLLLAGAGFYRSQQQSVRHDVEANLQAIAQLKAGQIVQWRAERLHDAEDVMSSAFLIDAIERWQSQARPDDLARIASRLRGLQKHQKSANVVLVDTAGRPLLDLAGPPGPLHPGTDAALATAFGERRPMLTDLHAGPDAPHLEIIAPLFNRDGRPVAAVIMQMGAEEFLYPLIQTWPTASRTAETLLVRRDGNDALFLNEIRHRPGTALTLRIPLSRTEVPAVMAVLGQEGLFDGHDYRGTPVLSVLRTIPDSPWAMVTKIDTDEAYADWHTRSLLILAIIAGLLGVVLAGGIALQRSLAHYKKLYRAETARRNAESRYGVTLMSVGDAVIATDAGGCIELMNPVAAALTGWSEQEALGKPLAEVFVIVNATTRQTVENPAEIVLRDGRAVDLAKQTLLIARDGSECPIADSAAPIRDSTEQIVGVVLVFRDQTHEQRTQRALQLLSNSSRALIRSTDEGQLLDHICRIAIEVGGYRLAWVGLAEADAEQSIRPIARSGFNDGYLEQMQASWADQGDLGHGPAATAIRRGRTVVAHNIATDPSMAPWREAALARGFHALIAMPLQNDGRAFGCFCVYAGEADVFSAEEVHVLEELASDLAFGISALRVRAELDHHRQHLEELVDRRTADLVEAKEAAEAATRAKSEFLANMSHEIRTPFNAIAGMAHLIRRAGVTPQQAERLDKIDTAGKHLLEIINTILDLSKIEAGKFVLEESEVNLGAIAANVASMLFERAQAKQLKLQLETEPLPHLLGDPVRLQQALLNYATNAVKFTERGSITLRAQLQEDSGEHVLVRFEVEDTGIGIAADTVGKLFSVFEQADNSITRKYGGTGLGLAITRKLAQLMDGDAGVVSQLGVGSTFWFTARLKKSERAVTRVNPVPDLSTEGRLSRDCRDRRILLVEDEPINCEVTEALLGDIGLRIDIARDGVEAVSMAAATDYDLILMDMQMPRMNGLDATRQIRLAANGKKLPILAMTANAFAEDKSQCLAAGMDDFISKPVDPEVLFAALLKWLAPATSSDGGGDRHAHR